MSRREKRPSIEDPKGSWDSYAPIGRLPSRQAPVASFSANLPEESRGRSRDRGAYYHPRLPSPLAPMPQMHRGEHGYPGPPFPQPVIPQMPPSQWYRDPSPESRHRPPPSGYGTHRRDHKRRETSPGKSWYYSTKPQHRADNGFWYDYSGPDHTHHHYHHHGEGYAACNPYHRGPKPTEGVPQGVTFDDIETAESQDGEIDADPFAYPLKPAPAPYIPSYGDQHGPLPSEGPKIYVPTPAAPAAEMPAPSHIPIFVPPLPNIPAPVPISCGGPPPVPPAGYTSSYKPPTALHERILSTLVVFITRAVPQEIYGLFLLHLPALYFSRVARIFEEADLTLGQIKKMALESGPSHTKSGRFNATWYPSRTQEMPVAYDGLKSTWELFIDSVLREWKTFNIISVLLLSAILTILQIDAAAGDALTRYTALGSLICALVSLLYGCMYIIRFGTMRTPYKAAEWALEAQKSQTSIVWNVWVMLAMPAVWLSWSLILYIACIVAFLWRTDTHDIERASLSNSGLLAVRIAITVLLGLGVLYGILILLTFSHYGEEMDKAWKRRIKAFTNTSQQGHRWQPYSRPYPRHRSKEAYGYPPSVYSQDGAAPEKEGRYRWDSEEDIRGPVPPRFKHTDGPPFVIHYPGAASVYESLKAKEGDGSVPVKLRGDVVYGERNARQEKAPIDQQVDEHTSSTPEVMRPPVPPKNPPSRDTSRKPRQSKIGAIPPPPLSPSSSSPPPPPAPILVPTKSSHHRSASDSRLTRKEKRKEGLPDSSDERPGIRVEGTPLVAPPKRLQKGATRAAPT